MPLSDTLTDLLNQIRAWLNARNVQTSLFRTEDAPGGKIILEIEFSTPDVATMFQREFAEGLPV